jgi:hypothetical protein
LDKSICFVSEKQGEDNTLLQFPFSVVEWTDITSFEPTRDTVEVESMLMMRTRTNQNKRRGEKKNIIHCKYPMQLYILHSLPIPDSLDSRYLFEIPAQKIRKIECTSKLTKIHNMVSTDGTVVYNNVPSPESNCIPL